MELAIIEKVRGALAALDPSVDSHWNKDGTPAIPYINILAGGGVTKAMVEELAPEFTRNTANDMKSDLAPKPTEPTVVTHKADAEQPALPADGQDAAMGGAGAPADIESTEPQREVQTVLVSSEMPEIVFRLGTLKSDFGEDEDLQLAITEMYAIVTNINIMSDKLNALRDQVLAGISEVHIESQKRNGATSSSSDNSGTVAYLNARKIHMAEKAEQMRALNAPEMRQLIKNLPQRSPLDLALARKR